MSIKKESAKKYDYLNLGEGNPEAYRLIEMFLSQVPEDQQNDVLDQIGAIGLTGPALVVLAIDYGAEFNDSHVDEKPGNLLDYAGRMSEMTLGELSDFLFRVEVTKFQVRNGRQLIGDEDSLGLKEMAYQRAVELFSARK